MITAKWKLFMLTLNPTKELDKVKTQTWLTVLFSSPVSRPRGSPVAICHLTAIDCVGWGNPYILPTLK